MGKGNKSNQMQFQEEQTVETWDRVSAQYNWKSYWGHDNQANLIVLLSEIGEPSGKKIIEVGCGSGFMSAKLASLGANVAILDKSEAAINVARGAFVSLGLQTFEFFAEDALDNSVPSDSYDVVWNGGVIEHFFDDGKRLLIKEMLRMAKPGGGKVIIMVPNAWCVLFRIGQAWQRLKGTWKFGYEDDMSPRRIKRMCQELGLQSVQTYSFNKVVGVAWFPRYGYRIANALGWDTLEKHAEKSCLGFVTIAIIQK